MHPRHQRTLLAATLIGAACSGPAQVMPDPVIPEPDGNHPAVETARQLIVERLTQERGGDARAPALLRLESVEYRDASLGCPEPGMAYAQVITPGYRVWMEVDGRPFDVRVAGNGGRICDRPAMPMPAPLPSDR